MKTNSLPFAMIAMMVLLIVLGSVTAYTTFGLGHCEKYSCWEIFQLNMVVGILCALFALPGCIYIHHKMNRQARKVDKRREIILAVVTGVLFSIAFFTSFFILPIIGYQKFISWIVVSSLMAVMVIGLSNAYRK